MSEQNTDANVPVPSSPEAEKPKIVATWGSQSIFDRPDERKMGRSMIGSLVLHGALFAAIILVFAVRKVETITKTEPPPDVVYLEQPGPRGGGGGSPTPAAPKKMEIPKPEVQPTPVQPVPVDPVPLPQLNAPVMTDAATMLAAAGAGIDLSKLGGGGTGGGIGSGNGNGLGPGSGGGFGGGVYHPGNGCTNPSPIHQADPKYTSDAMRAKLQGDVEVDAVVLKSGMVGDVKVTKSLDTQFGLDKEAIAAAKQWVFKAANCPGVGKVDMLVTLVIEFRLH